MTYAAQTVALTGMATMEAANLGLQTDSALAASIPLEGLSDDGGTGRSRYLLVGVGLAATLAGCSEPQPAPIAHETQLPPNQRPCSPGSQSPYCQHQALVLSEMRTMREEGHHTDQTLFLILGLVTLLSAVGNVFQFARNRRLKKRLAQSINPTPPPPPQPTSRGIAPRIGE